MSKSKEEYVNVINKKFNAIDNKKDSKSLFLALEESIKYITNSEFSLVFLIDNHKKMIKTFCNSREVEILLEESILEDVFLSKKYFFDNYIVNNHKYNEKVDNILNIEIESIIVVPIIDKIKGEVVACISAFNSVNCKREFKRYDVRLLGLLEHHVFNLVKIMNIKIDDRFNRKIDKPLSVVEKVTKRKTKRELEYELKAQKEKIIALERELILSKELLEIEKRENQECVVTVVQEEEVVLDSDIYTILEFLTNEVTYLANEEHKIYLFLEIIKNSLHNKEQLHFLNMELEKIGLIENIATKLYRREKMPIVLNSFNIHQLMNDVAILYSKIFSDKNIILNLFLSPTIPTFLESDKYKIKSIIIHLVNNLYNFTTSGGAVEIDLEFSDISEHLTIEIKSRRPYNIEDLYKEEDTDNSLTSSNKGLGLSVSSNLINILGGKLKLSALENNEHVFSVSLPIKKSKKSENINFMDSSTIKIAILTSEYDRNYYVLENLLKYFRSMGIDEESIVIFKNMREVNSRNFSHLFCFENLFSFEVDFADFSSVTVLKYSQNSVNFRKNKKEATLFNELYINSYYSLKLQKILFPNMKIEKLKKNTLITEDSFLSKFSNVIKKLKL